MKLLLIVLLRFAFVWCDVSNNIACQTYDKNEKFLLQRCDKYQILNNCTSNVSDIQSPDEVLRVKLQGCDSSAIGDISEQYKLIEQLDISHAGLHSLGDQNKPFVYLTDFNASFNSLHVFPKEFIQKCPRLKNLDLSYNYLSRIDHGDFEQSQQFNGIDLSHNSVETIHPHAFSNLSDLQVLRLNNNRLATIPPLHFLNNAVTLHLEQNHLLSSFNCTSIAAMSRVVTVHLSWQYITSFLGDQGCGARKFRIRQGDNTNNGTDRHEGVSSTTTGNWQLFCSDQSFRNLQHFVAGPMGFENIHDILPLISATVLKLDLTDNDIGVFNQSIFERFRTLYELRLSNTKLTKFDVGALNKNNQKYLNRIDISQNHLKEIENSWMLKYFSNLLEFNAAGNSIQNASEVIEHLPSSVEQLNVAHSNHVNDVNRNTFSRLTNLRHLDLSDTQLAIDDFDVFRSLERLTNFQISQNDLSRVNFTALASLSQLQEFRAANCRIGNIGDVIQYLGPYVVKLDLSDNAGAANNILHSNAFERFENLKELSLGNVGLQQIDSGIFEHLVQLTDLDLAGNHLDILDFDRFPSSLERLDLHGNNLQEIKHLNRTRFRALRMLNVSQNQLNCDYLDELRTQFNDKILAIDHPSLDAFEQQSGKCHSNLLRIVLWCIAAFALLLIVGCLCFLCCKYLCEQKH